MIILILSKFTMKRHLQKIKTNTNEITYWMSQRNSHSSFEVFTFSLLLNNEVIGFSMMTYLQNSKAMIFEYISLVSQYRVNTVFLAFINLMQNYPMEKGIDVNYFVVEISNKEDGTSIDKESRLFKKLICLEDYGIINVNYSVLPLGLDDEGSFDAKIHIKSSDKITSMKRKTYLDIVSSIYFDYTVNWYKAFLDVKEVESFEESAKSYFKLIKRKCDNKDNIEIVYNDCPIYDESVFISTTGHLPSSSKIRDYGKYPIIFFYDCDFANYSYIHIQLFAKIY